MDLHPNPRPEHSDRGLEALPVSRPEQRRLAAASTVRLHAAVTQSARRAIPEVWCLPPFEHNAPRTDPHENRPKRPAVVFEMIAAVRSSAPLPR